MHDAITKHANMLVINGVGVLITGKPDIGKSEISLALIDRGHQFVSDDATELARQGQEIIGASPEVINRFMQIDRIGLLNIEKLFGVMQCVRHHRVDLCIILEKPGETSSLMEPLEPMTSELDILGVSIPCYHLMVIIGKQLPLLIEIVVRNFAVEQSGYNALQDLKRQQKIALERN